MRLCFSVIFSHLFSARFLGCSISIILILGPRKKDLPPTRRKKRKSSLLSCVFSPVFFFFLFFFFKKKKNCETLKCRMCLTSLFLSYYFDATSLRRVSRVVRHHGRRRRRSHGHHRHDDDGTTTKSTTKEKDRGEKMERGCRLVVVDVVRFVRDLQKHVARTVDQFQASNVRGQGEEEGLSIAVRFFFFFDDHLLLQKKRRRRRLDRFFFFVVVVVFQRFSKRCFT